MKKFPSELLRILGLSKQEGVTPLRVDESTYRIYFDYEISEKTIEKFRKMLNNTYWIEKTSPRTIDLEKKRSWNLDWEL